MGVTETTIYRFECERCGEVCESKWDDSMSNYRRLYLYEDGHTEYDPEQDVFLCPPCVQSLKDWLALPVIEEDEAKSRAEESEADV